MMIEIDSNNMPKSKEELKAMVAEKLVSKDNVYTRNGYKNRRDYLDSLIEEYGVPAEIVYAAADLLGKEEDFDGLVTTLEDYCDY